MQTITVPPIGDRHSQIVIVGEAPGETEIAEGVPFVGQSGVLLSTLLHTAGIVRNHCYITNVVKERPTKNNIKIFLDVEKGKVTDEYLAYEEQLKAELSETTANVIIAVGGTALYALTRQEGVMKWRGSVLESTLLPGRKVIPIIHPASAMRAYNFRHFILADLRKALHESKTPDITRPKYTIHMQPSFVQIETYIKALPKTVAFDIEVMNQEVSCLTIANSPTESMCIPFVTRQGEYFPAEQEAQVLKLIGAMLEDDSITKVMQNGSFDASFMNDRYNIRTTNIDDTMIAQGLITPEFPKGLGFLCSMYTDQEYYKDDGKEWFKNPVGDESAFWRYNAIDAMTLLTIFPQQVKELHRLSLWDTYDSHRRLIQSLMYIQRHGIRMDTEAMALKEKTAALDIELLLAKLEELAGMPLNPNSPKQLSDYFYIRKGIAPYKAKGRPTTNEKAMMRLAKRGFPEAEIIVKIRKLRKLCNTYLNAKLDKDNYLRCAMNPIGTVTGRLASSKTIFGTGMNMQNQPSIMKQYMLLGDAGGPEMVGFNVDLGGAENRIVANMGPVPAMLQAFKEGIDVHCLTASRIFSHFRGTKVHWTDISRDATSAPEIGDGMTSERQWGKKMNHSSNYGITAYGLSEAFSIKKVVAATLLDVYHKTYPEIRGCYQRTIEELLKGTRSISNPLGRSRVFYDRMGDSLLQDAYAWPPQSTIADIINRYGLNHIYENQDIYKELELLNQVHDSIVFQIPLSVGWQNIGYMIRELVKSLTRPIQWKAQTFSIPLDVDVLHENLGTYASVDIDINKQDALSIGDSIYKKYESLRVTS